MTRFTVSVTAALVAAVPSIAVLAVPTPASSAAVVQRVTADDLGAFKPWIRLQDDPSNATRRPGVQEVSPFADPVRFNGSLHLSVAPDTAAAPFGQQAQAAHYFTRKIPLSTIAASELSYDMYVRSLTSTASAIPLGANLQLPMICRGTFTTLSFLPQLATDSQGRTGAVADIWRHFVSSGTSQWYTSQTVSTALLGGSNHPLNDYVSACTSPGDGVIGVIANVGRIGSTVALDTYVDNLTVNNTVYDFRVRRTAVGNIRLADGFPDRAGRTTRATVVFTDPSEGPHYVSIGTRLVFSQRRGLSPRDLIVTANGQPLTLTRGPGDTVSAVLSAPNTDLMAGGRYITPITVSFGRGGTYSARPQRGDLTLTAELLAQGYAPLQPTGVRTGIRLRGW